LSALSVVMVIMVKIDVSADQADGSIPTAFMRSMTGW
jgi:hypothetical protein